MAKVRVEETVEKLGNQVAEELEFELVDVEYRKEGPDWVLRYFIDCPTGVGIDECQRFSQAISTVLDAEDPIPGSYLLEVSSPGVERPLKKLTDYVKFTGSQVEIKLHKAYEGQKIFRGELLGINETEMVGVRINSSTIELPFKEIAKAKLITDLFGGEGGSKRK